MRNLALALTALAGFVDVVAFLSLGAFFASFMSGNSTRLAIGMGGLPNDAWLAITLILSFVGGVIAATLLARPLGERRPQAVLFIVAALLALTALIAAPHQPQPVLILACAMGMVNTLFERDGEVAVGITYMTGTLVRFGQNFARWMTGQAHVHDWLGHLLMWLSFLGGGMIGVGCYMRLGMTALWLPALVAAGLALWLGWGDIGPRFRRAPRPAIVEPTAPSPTTH